MKSFQKCDILTKMRCEKGVSKCHHSREIMEDEIKKISTTRQIIIFVVVVAAATIDRSKPNVK